MWSVFTSQCSIISIAGPEYLLLKFSFFSIERKYKTLCSVTDCLKMGFKIDIFIDINHIVNTTTSVLQNAFFPGQPGKLEPER